MSKEFEGLAKDLRTDAGPLAGKASTAFANMQAAMEQFGNTSKSFAAVADQLEATVKENRGPLRDFSSTGLNELTQFLNEARVLVASMTRISSQIERDPARFLLGDRSQGFQPQ
jgi:phospholipid/cholesterol/gamma-HCH transport system substrate-binding protein